MTRTLLFASSLIAAGCAQSAPATVTGLSSIAVTMVSPGPDMLGNPAAPISTQDFVVDLNAIDANNQPFAEDIDVDVFISYAGNKIGTFTPCGNDEDVVPLQTIRLAGGQALAQTIHVEKAYGISNIWVQEEIGRASCRERV